MELMENHARRNMRLTRLAAVSLGFWVGFGFASRGRAVGACSIVLPPLSEAELKNLDRAEASGRRGPLQIGFGRVFDQPIVLGVEQVTPGNWLKLYDGSSSVSFNLTSPGALGLKLHFEQLKLPAPVQLLLYDAKNPSAPKVSIVGAEIIGRTEFWADTIFSEQVLVECRVPAGIDPKEVHLKLGAVSHLYRLPVLASPKEGGCHNDVTCFPEWAEAAASVARITYVAGKNTYLCTGCLLENANGSSRADYFLAARHCITSQSLASTIEFYWMYQTANCDDTPPALSTVPHTSGGGLILASGRRSCPGQERQWLQSIIPMAASNVFALAACSGPIRIFGQCNGPVA
jgi:hypothetical protein